MNFFKKKRSPEQIAATLYRVLIKDTVKEPLKDHDGNILLDENQQHLLILSHLCSFLKNRSLGNVRFFLLNIFVADNYKIRDESERLLKLMLLMDSTKKIDDFFKLLPMETYELFLKNLLQKEFLFGKNINSIQKVFVLDWHMEITKAINLTLDNIFKKFKVTSDLNGKK